MDGDAWATVAVAVLGVVGVLVEAYRRSADRRGQIEQDLRIWAALPEESPQREPLLESVERRIGQALIDEQARRDPFGVTLALMFLAIAGYFYWLAGQTSPWVYLAVVPFALFGCVGLYQDGRRQVRDDRGRAVGRGQRARTDE